MTTGRINQVAFVAIQLDSRKSTRCTFRAREPSESATQAATLTSIAAGSYSTHGVLCSCFVTKLLFCLHLGGLLERQSHKANMHREWDTQSCCLGERTSFGASWLTATAVFHALAPDESLHLAELLSIGITHSYNRFYRSVCTHWAVLTGAFIKVIDSLVLVTDTPEYQLRPSFRKLFWSIFQPFPSYIVKIPKGVITWHCCCFFELSENKRFLTNVIWLKQIPLITSTP